MEIPKNEQLHHFHNDEDVIVPLTHPVYNNS